MCITTYMAYLWRTWYQRYGILFEHFWPPLSKIIPAMLHNHLFQLPSTHNLYNLDTVSVSKPQRELPSAYPLCDTNNCSTTLGNFPRSVERERGRTAACIAPTWTLNFWYISWSVQPGKSSCQPLVNRLGGAQRRSGLWRKQGRPEKCGRPG